MGYLNFITDEHLFRCIGNLHAAYNRANQKVDEVSFSKNKIDIFKFVFDEKFHAIDSAEVVKREIARQIDKTINNSIGTFHEEILGGVENFERGKLSGYDIKAINNSLFADLKNKHNTANSSALESLYQKLKKFADEHKSATCYWVQVLAKDSFNEHWMGEINGKEYNHSRVRKISGDQFYALLTGEREALYNLYKALPEAIDEFLLRNKIQTDRNHTALSELKRLAKTNSSTLRHTIAHQNFNYYAGFDFP